MEPVYEVVVKIEVRDRETGELVNEKGYITTRESHGFSTSQVVLRDSNVSNAWFKANSLFQILDKIHQIDMI